MTNILDGLLGRVDDPSLRAALQVEVDRMRSTKDFGLVFENGWPPEPGIALAFFTVAPAAGGCGLLLGEALDAWLVARWRLRVEREH